MKVLNLTKNQKEQLFLVLGRKTPYFPHHCVDVAYVLSKYMKDNGIDCEVRLYNKIMHNESQKKCNHFVVYSHGYIYDFSLCQFYIPHKLSKSILKNISDEEFIETYLYEYQNGNVVFKEEDYHKMFEYLENQEVYTNTGNYTPYDYVHCFFTERKWQVKSVNKLIHVLNNVPEILSK